jgi:hypothetical protein
MHLLDLGDMKEVVEVHRVEVADPQRHHAIEDAALILVLQPVPVLDLAVVVVLLAPTVVVARDLEHLKELTVVKIVLLMIGGQDPYHLPEKILNVAILVHPLLDLVRKLEIDLQPQMVVLLLLALNQGVQHAVLSLEVPRGIEHY